MFNVQERLYFILYFSLLPLGIFHFLWMYLLIWWDGPNQLFTYSILLFILNYVQICFQFNTRFNKISKETLFYFVFLCNYHLFKELSLF